MKKSIEKIFKQEIVVRFIVCGDQVDDKYFFQHVYEMKIKCIHTE